MLTVDILHEVELGVWKALLTHLIQMLHACGGNKVHQFDEWYVSLLCNFNNLPQVSFWMVPAFSDSVCHFEGNVSEMKSLAGHNLEDVLQVCCPTSLY